MCFTIFSYLFRIIHPPFLTLYHNFLYDKKADTPLEQKMSTFFTYGQEAMNLNRQFQSLNELVPIPTNLNSYLPIKMAEQIISCSAIFTLI